jgi:FAD/FMN-containing dehydrogenase/ferredoxin
VYPADSVAEKGHPDLHSILQGGRALEGRDAPARTLQLAASLRDHVAAAEAVPRRFAETVEERIVTDELLRREADRDQNVYLGKTFTRRFTHAVPDLVFLPGHAAEVSLALQWARENHVPVTVRGAASAALGGAVPADGGLTLDLARLDHVDVDPNGEVCIAGAGARMREIHVRLAERGLALPVYSSNLGGTVPGWLVGGGLGLNSFGPRRVLDVVRAADVVLPSGEMVRLHADGRLDVPGERSYHGHRELPPDQTEAWFQARGVPPFGLADLAGSEGILCVVVQVVMTVGRRPPIGAFLLGFESVAVACEAAAAVAAAAGTTMPRPVNLKLVGAGFLREQRRVWEEEDARAWRRLPSALSDGEGMPWTEIVGPAELGAPLVKDGAGAAGEANGAPAAPAACLYVDFLDLEAARRFAGLLDTLPGAPRALDTESVRVARERFRPQQSKRLGPGLLAAEIELPAAEVPGFLARAAKLARGAGVALDPEVYYLSNDEALVIAGYLTDHRRASFQSDLMVTPALLDLAIKKHGGRPYVLGRWQAWFARDRFGEAGLERLRALKTGLDPETLVNRGVVLGPDLQGTIGGLVESAYRPLVGAARRVWATPVVSAGARLGRAALRPFAGPARGRGEPVPATGRPLPAAARALHCVNCGECNVVCPAYDSALVRLPQTLTHLGERLQARERLPGSSGALLDLCFCCGNCEEVCQAGIPHLALYERLRVAVGGDGSIDRERHVAVLEHVRDSDRYRDDFLAVRPGQYQRRAPAALSGTVRFFVVRAENDAGPAATCLHCAACVPVCPTGANREYEAGDARLVTTDEYECVGCGTCVEVCPANRANGGQTLRVFEVPAPAWLQAVDEFERQAAP